MSPAFSMQPTSATSARLVGRIDAANAAQALAAGKQIPANGNFELDLEHLESADSVTLAVLLAWSAAASRSQCRLVYRGMSDRLRAIARLGDATGMLGTSDTAPVQGT